MYPPASVPHGSTDVNVALSSTVLLLWRRVSSRGTASSSAAFVAGVSVVLAAGSRRSSAGYREKNTTAGVWSIITTSGGEDSRAPRRVLEARFANQRKNLGRDRFLHFSKLCKAGCQSARLRNVRRGRDAGGSEVDHELKHATDPEKLLQIPATPRAVRASQTERSNATRSPCTPRGHCPELL